MQAETLRGAAEIGLAVGAVVNKRKVKKHFQLEIEDEHFEYARKQHQIAEEAALDGFYVLRTNVPAEQLKAAEVVRSHKGLAAAERAFRTLKGPEFELRPIHHRLEQRVPAHAFLCLLAYYLEWHLPKRKASTQRTAAGGVCHSFRSLLRELALVVRSNNRVPGSDATFDTVTDPNPTQARAFELIELITKAT